RHLTSFYLLLSAGGAAGGIFVAILAPSIFPTFWEDQLGLLLIALLLLVILFRDRTSWLHNPKPHLFLPTAALKLLLLIPQYFVHARMIAIPASLYLGYNFCLGLLIPVCIWLAFSGGTNWAEHRKFRWYETTSIGSFLLLTAALCVQVNANNEYT